MKWIYLQQVLGYGAKNARKIIMRLGKDFEISQLGTDVAEKIGMSPSQIKKIGNETLLEAKRIANLCKQNGIAITNYFSPEYPQNLRDISDLPVVLYSLGEKIDFNKSVCIAAVGTRKISEHGKRAAFSLCARLSLCGAVIISGGALGGDTFSHLGALAAGGKTVAVTGGGVLSEYLKTNEYLRADILKGGGMLLSEFAPDYVPRTKNSFGQRNRIIAALCDAAAIAETTTVGGSIITANEVLKLYKPLYVVKSGREDDGAGQLISRGATELVSAEEILAEFENINIENITGITPARLKQLYAAAAQKADRNQKPKPKFEKRRAKVPKNTVRQSAKPQPPCEIFADDNMNAVFKVTDNPITADEITEKTGLDISKVMIALTKLEIAGAIKAIPGSRYIAKKQ